MALAPAPPPAPHARPPRRPAWRSALAFLPALAPVFVPLGWRFAPDLPWWAEAHGTAAVRHLAARPEGAIVVDGGGHLSRYPGEFGQPWVGFSSEIARAVAAGGSTVFWLDGAGGIRCQGRECKPAYEGSSGWGLTALAADDGGELYAIAGGRARRVEGGELRPVGCEVESRAIAAREGTVYVVTPGGELHAAAGGACARMDAPARLKHVAAGRRGRLAAVDESGVAHLCDRGDGGAWRALPAPRFYRLERFPQRTSVAEVALSAQTLWAMSPEGYVFMLFDAP